MLLFLAELVVTRVDNSLDFNEMPVPANGSFTQIGEVKEFSNWHEWTYVDNSIDFNKTPYKLLVSASSNRLNQSLQEKQLKIHKINSKSVEK